MPTNTLTAKQPLAVDGELMLRSSPVLHSQVEVPQKTGWADRVRGWLKYSEENEVRSDRG